MPESSWRLRHTAIVALLWAHAVAVPIIAVVRGFGIVHVLVESSILPATAIGAMLPRVDRRARTAVASVGLLTASGILVHLSGGLIEMHFHFFVMVAVVSLYQDWLPFLAAIAYVLLHHGIVGVLAPESVYNHESALENPWRWAAVHAAFVSAISVACLVTWKFNELTSADRDRAEERLREESRIAETLRGVGEALAQDLDTQRVVQTVTDAATEVTEAAFGAFFYNVVDTRGEAYMLYALSGAPIDAFERFGLPRNTPVFGPTFAGEGVVRLDDVTKDRRYGTMAPHFGMPKGHLPVCSYLAVPVRSRTGDVLGGLFFGHPEPGRFTRLHERIVVGIAAQAAMAFDNARLYESERNARTSAETAGAKLSVLAEAGTILNSSLELDALLGDLGQLVTSTVADYCVLDIANDDGSTHRLVAVARGDRRERIADVAPTAPAPDEDPVGWVTEALLGGGFGEAVAVAPPASVVVVPIRSRDEEMGLLWLAASSARPELGPHDRQFAEELGRRVASAVHNARTFARQRTLAETLQHSLLPERLPQIPGIQTAARYVAGGPGVEVGGDWYDVIQLSGGRIGLAIGDVVGKGERAAALMGHLRSALRAYGTDGRSPAEVMERLNALLLDTGPDQMATVVYVVLDPEDGVLRFVNAGHPPPLLALPDGRAWFLEDTRGMPIGALPGAHYVESTATLDAGALLLLYTDGLVEDRANSIDVGLDRLRAAVASDTGDLDRLCEAVLAEALAGRDAHDDTAVLAVRLPVLGAALDIRVPSNPNMLAPLRSTLRRWLAGVGADETERFEILVAAGELFTNAIRHGSPTRGYFDVHADARDGINISVVNHGPWRERRGDVGGRGLQMADVYCDSVEVDRRATETEVRMRRRIAREPVGS
ncbi:MAG TPA: SpoIIE family protein phosphatase [Frankiaceae bacterium]|nr:SpoIIE family protein phosphatase [Frankiaceae bacterium]